MRFNVRTIAVSSAVLTIVGGAAFAYTVSASSATQASGGVKKGTVAVASATLPAEGVTLGVAAPVAVKVSVTGSPVKVSTITIAADPDKWKVADCGPISGFHGVTAAAVTGTPVVKEADGNKSIGSFDVTLDNDDATAQDACTVPMLVTVNPS